MEKNIEMKESEKEAIKLAANLFNIMAASGSIAAVFVPVLDLWYKFALPKKLDGNAGSPDHLPSGLDVANAMPIYLLSFVIFVFLHFLGALQLRKLK